ncbi:MAG: hypothetical protein LBU90_05365 [Bacteroidales bacterium]|jgi:hypothetical protein|nr:hypothetical protein [Bacteroidales bacterium]
MIEKIKKLRLSKLFRNCYFLFAYDTRKELNELREKIGEKHEEIQILKNKVLILNIFNYYHEFPELKKNLETELSFLLNNSEDIIFPYKQIKKMDSVQSGYDSAKEMPYVVHHEKRLYFPKTYSCERAVWLYRNFIEKENLLGGNYTEKAPHQYETEDFCVQNGDVVLDIGAAEGLFALNAVDKAKKIYVIESDIFWIEALEATFEPYKNSVEIINTLISNSNTEHSITLSSILEKEQKSPIFVKMDIEGYEPDVIKESKTILPKCVDIRLACCTYHKQNDGEELQQIFTSLGFDTEFSEGYMLFHLDELNPPYFRKGIIRARNRIIKT